MRPTPLLTGLAAAALLASPTSAQTLLHTDAGPTFLDEHGSAVANAGDVDGDGVDDVLAGAPEANSGTGMVRLISGRTGAVLFERHGAAVNERLGQAVTGLGDQNGDGHAEFAYSAPGSSQPVGALTEYDRIVVWDWAADAPLREFWQGGDHQAGWSLAGDMDGDGDGRNDLLVGLPRYDCTSHTGCGLVRRYAFSATGVITMNTPVLAGEEDLDQLGWDVAWLGDTDGDGVNDFAASAPFHDHTTLLGTYDDVGQVYVSDAWGVPLWDVRGPLQDDGHHGWALAGGHDLDEDGLPDLVVGSPFYDDGVADRGHIDVRRGHDGALLAWRHGDAAGHRFGHDVATASDLSGRHVLVGAPGYGSSDSGFVYGYRMTGGALFAHIDINGGGTHSELGSALAVLGDMNTDGGYELAAGAPFPGVSQRGEVQLFSSLDQDAASEQLGTGLAGTTGVPALTVSGAPVLGGQYTLGIGSSATTTTTAALFLGVGDVAPLAFKGGALWFVPLVTLNLPPHPPAGLSLPIDVPKDHTLAGLPLLFQAAMQDPGAPFGVALTPGVRVVYGG